MRTMKKHVLASAVAVAIGAMTGSAMAGSLPYDLYGVMSEPASDAKPSSSEVESHTLWTQKVQWSSENMPSDSPENVTPSDANFIVMSGTWANVYGGYSSSGTTEVKCNVVTVTGDSSVNNVYGGLSNDTASDNKVKIAGIDSSFYYISGGTAGQVAKKIPSK